MANTATAIWRKAQAYRMPAEQVGLAWRGQYIDLPARIHIRMSGGPDHA